MPDASASDSLLLSKPTIQTALTIGPDAYVDVDEHASEPSTPEAGNVRLFAKASGHLHQKDDAGTVTDLTAPGALTIPSQAHGDLLFRGSAAWARLAAGTKGQVLTTQGSAADPTFADIPLQLPFVSSRYYAGITTALGAAYGLTANRLYAAPFLVHRQTAFDRIAVNVATADAGKSVRLGIYDDSSGLPGALKLDAGAVSVGATGEAFITISQTLPPAWYWLALASESGVAQIDSSLAPAAVQFGLTAVGDAPPTHLFKTHTFGALPNPFGGSLTYSTTRSPRLLLRAE